MRLKGGNRGFILLAVVASAAFVRLGVWQLDRLGERRAANTLRAERVALPPLELTGTLSLSAEEWEGRRGMATGEYDLSREILLRARTRAGRQGVHLLTPLVLDDGPDGKRRALLVLRGWLPAADGFHAPLGDARPAGGALDAGTRATVAGVVQAGALMGDRRDSVIVREVAGEEHGILTLLDLEAASRFLPYAVITELYLRASEPGLAGPGLVVLPEPEVSEGSHLVYAIQWFSFAAIALIGTLFYVRRN